MGNYFSYSRISTKESADKQRFNRQEKSLKSYAEKNNIEYLLEFKDDCSGSSFTRKEWKKLEKVVQEGDTIVFKEISRFTRQATRGYKKYMQLMNEGINLVFIDNPTVDTDYIKNLTKIAEEQDIITRTALESTIKLLIIVELDRVEKERELIVKRIKQGIEASDKKSGRKEGQLDKMTPELEKDIKEYQVNRSIKQIDLMKKHNISRNTLKKYVKLVDAKNKNKSISSEEAEDYGEISKDNFKLTYTYGDDEYTYTRGFISKSSMEAYIKIGKEKDLRVKRIEEI